MLCDKNECVKNTCAIIQQMMMNLIENDEND